MNFLYPLFLAGSLAVVLPIVFHLIRRSTKTKVPFSTLRFLQPTPPKLTKKSRLEHLWLLLLRCLILLLLAFAFARPYVEEALDPEAVAENPQRNLFLIDTSASMKRSGAWDRAIELLSDRVNDIDAGSLAAAYTFDSQLHPVVTFEQWSQAPRADRSLQIVNQTKQREPTWKSTHLGNALLTSVDLLEESTRIGENNRDTQDWRIIVISDLQSGMLLDGIQGFDWPKGCTVDFVPLELTESSNVGIHAVPNTGAYASLVETENARIRISNTEESRKETFRYGWVPSADSNTLAASTEIYLPPGKSRIVEAPEAPEGVSANILSIQGDDHDFDNTAWRVPLRARQSKVVYFGAPNSSDSNELLYYLEKAFQQTQRHVVSLEILPPDQPIVDSTIADARLIVIGAPLEEGVARQVNGHIANGITCLLAYHQDTMESTLRELAQDPSLTIQGREAERYALFGEIDFQHPLFSSFADPRFSDFSKIKFWSHYQLNLEGHETARVIARFDSQFPAISEFPVKQGSLIVTAFGWQPKLSQFALSTKFVPFLYSLLDFGAGVHDVRSHYLVGQAVDLSSLTEADSISVTTPGGETFNLEESRQFLATDTPGIYTIETGDTSIRFAVNLHPNESDTTQILDETLLGLGIPGIENLGLEKPNPIVEAAQEKLKAAEIEERQKYWKWIVLAALVIASLETLSAGFITRRASTA